MWVDIRGGGEVLNGGVLDALSHFIDGFLGASLHQERAAVRWRFEQSPRA